MDKTVPLGRVKGTLTPPCSKSYAQRALAASLLCGETSVLRNLEFCDDTRSALRCIETLGARVKHVDASTLSIEGGLHPRGKVLHVGESGLATRLFTPIASLCGMPVTIEGQGTLLRRPMHMMIDPLRRLGVRVRDNDGYLPFEVRGPIRGGEIDVDGSVSSQFITGLLLALPLSQHDTTLHVRSAVSTPYLDMTVDTAARFGVEICHNDYKEFYIEGGQRYRPAFFSIEGDWSAAAMLLVAGAVAGEVTVKNVSMLSKQADTAICTALVRAGAAVINDEDSVTASHRPLRAFEFDATHCPDLFPALAALAAAAQGESVIRGTSRLEHKECNRADAIREEYAKAGIEVDTSQEDVMRIRGGRIRQARVQSHGDHRMAMSMAVAGLLCDGEMTIEGAECVAKSYPGFFEDLEKSESERHEYFRTQFQARHLGRVARPADRHLDRRGSRRYSALGGRFRSRPCTPPQRGPRHHAAPRAGHPADRIGALQRHDDGGAAHHRIRQHRHPFAGLRHRSPPLPAFARRPGGLPPLQRVQRPAGRRPFLGTPDRGVRRRGRRRQEDAPAGHRLRHAHHRDRRMHRPCALRRGAARGGGRPGFGRRNHRMPRTGRPTGTGTTLLRFGRSLIAHLLFAVPAVKGVEFGSGFAGARMRGSQNNDPLLDVEGTTATNNAGGINGGITNGNEIVVRAAVKPTPSIGREQNTYNLATDKVEPLTIRGRHDVCVALRGAVVAEAAVAIALANLIRH